MKIVCMDCQTESYAEVELLKDKKHFECDHCAGSLPAGAAGYLEEPLPLPSNGNIELYTGPTDEPSFQSDISKLEEDDVLEISDMPSVVEVSEPQEIDEVILLPPCEAAAGFSEVSLDTAHVDNTPQPLEAVSSAPFQLQQLPSKFIHAAETSRREVASLNRHPLFEENLSGAPAGSKGLRLVSVTTPVLLGVAVAFVLFVVLGNMIAPKGKVSSNTIAPTQTVSLPENAGKQVVVAAPTESPEMSKPVPVPTAPPMTENKPTEAAPAVNQPSVIAKGQFTVQVGSHNDVEEANAQAAKLSAAGFEPRIVSVDIPKRGRWYRIQTGSFGSRDEANRYGAQIVAKGAAANFVVAVP
jgi:cell division septation protein DedD